MDIVEFLTARLDEDQRAAELVVPSRRTWQLSDAERRQVRMTVNVGPLGGSLSPGECWHALRHDPARVLADVAAKRAILALHGDQHDDGDPKSWQYPYEGCDTLRALLLPYADHPDFDPAWTVGE